MKALGYNPREPHGMANDELMQEFWDKCLQKLDQQLFQLESEESKKLAIQCVQRTLRTFDEKESLKIIRYVNWKKAGR